MVWPLEEVAADKSDATPMSGVHAAHHNELAVGVNTIVEQVVALETGVGTVTGQVESLETLATATAITLGATVDDLDALVVTVSDLSTDVGTQGTTLSGLTTDVGTLQAAAPLIAGWSVAGAGGSSIGANVWVADSDYTITKFEFSHPATATTPGVTQITAGTATVYWIVNGVSEQTMVWDLAYTHVEFAPSQPDLVNGDEVYFKIVAPLPGKTDGEQWDYPSFAVYGTRA